MVLKIILVLTIILTSFCGISQEILLNGKWETGIERNYTRTIDVPSISEDPTIKTPGTVWFKREVQLREGSWTNATLILNGARFSPEVYVNDILTSMASGGMAPTFHFLKHKDIKPGNKITLEIALKSLNDLKEYDASYIPTADHWRSNISSGLWDDVKLRLHGEVAINSVIPFIYQERGKGELKVRLNQKYLPSELRGNLKIMDAEKTTIIKSDFNVNEQETRVTFVLDKLKKWTPETPNLYTAQLTLKKGNVLLDTYEINLANNQFRVKEKQFYLNGKPCKLRAGTVVWHRWMRDREGIELGYNEEWFLKNVVKRLKGLGANALRFHLGTPPERFLDMCDKHGLLVQYEWSFFHGMPASKRSLLIQWKYWLDLAMKHPSVVIIHPYNEIGGEQVKTAWEALNELLPEYPELVLANRDVLHIHKYWWSLFENLGLYYDSYKQFPKAIMVDEFGGNYIDGNGNPGDYPTVKSAFLRFLGKNHTRDMRLYHHNISNAKIAEYWRRIDAAGFSPFCILGSHEDGSHWFKGDLKDGAPKPVWKALAASYAPISVSLSIWDRNYKKDEKIEIPLHLFNDLGKLESVNITYGIRKGQTIISLKRLDTSLLPYSHLKKNISISLPGENGKFTIFAKIETNGQKITYPVESTWDVRVIGLEVSEELKKSKIMVLGEEDELTRFFTEQGLKINNKRPDIAVGSLKSWEKISNNDQDFMSKIEDLIIGGTSVVLLDFGPRFFGQATIEKELDPLQGRYRVKEVRKQSVSLPMGVQVEFREISEPESHIHPGRNRSLWKNLPYDANWLWNGRRGGLIVPATEMLISGLSQEAFLKLWETRGANIEKIKNGQYVVFNLNGNYAYAESINDLETRMKLRKKIKFLAEDAPSLKNVLDPNAVIEVTDLSLNYTRLETGKAEKLIPLAICGGSLEKIPVIQIGYSNYMGTMVLSQLLTNNRLSNPNPEITPYPIKQDQAARQTIINILENLIVVK